MHIFSEIRILKGNTKGIVFILLFRISNFFTKNFIYRVIGFPFRIFYKFFVQWILGIDIPDSTKIGFGFNVYHGQGLIINNSVIFGEKITIRQNTTIGNSTKNGRCPVIGNHVNIGANVVIIGDIEIGDYSVIGAGSVVIKDVPEKSVVAGNPARIIRRLKKKLRNNYNLLILKIKNI